MWLSALIPHWWNATKRIRLDLRLQDLVAGETIASVAETGEEAKLFELVTRAGVHLREPLEKVDSTRLTLLWRKPRCLRTRKQPGCMRGLIEAQSLGQYCRT